MVGEEFGEWSEQLHHASKVVLVARARAGRLWIEEIVTGGQLEGHAPHRPDVGRVAVSNVEQHFGGAILTRLDVVAKVVGLWENVI